MVHISKIHIAGGKVRTLSPLERKVLVHLWKVKRAKARDIHRRMGKGTPLTSVAVTMNRLHNKKLVSRKIGYGRGGGYYVYAPVISKEDFDQSVIETAVNRLIDNFGGVAVNYFNSRFSKGKKDW